MTHQDSEEEGSAHEVNIFIGYQFTSSPTSRTTLLTRIVEGIERVESDINNEHPNSLRLHLSRLNLVSARAMGTQILDAIDASDVCIFEISELNPNVLFEMGYAEGRSKRSIYLLHFSMNINSLPSDIKQDYVEQYQDDRLDIKLGKQLKLVLEMMYPDLTVE